MHLHILGICGTFMAGIAAIARETGHAVTGCDKNVYPPMSTQLEALGIEVTAGYDASQLSTVAAHADLFVIGNAITRGNALLEAILDRDLPMTSGPQWLSEHALRGRFVIAIAGTHGKTTTTALTAWILECAGLAPGFLIGGVARDFDVSARRGDGTPFVIEADEYDTAFFDKRSKFLHYRARVAVLNNLEYDHADIFPDLAAIERQFHHWVRTLPRSACVVANADDGSVRRVLERGAYSEVERFGDAPDATWTIGEDGAISHRGERQGVLSRFSLSGRHNRLNAVAAIAAAHRAGVSVETSIAALARFGGVKRRLELKGRPNGIAVYDDFAHHPTAIATTLEGLRRDVGGARILAVLEPRSNTMKLGTMKAELPASLSLADRVYCYGANLGWDAAAALAPLGARASVHDDIDALVDAIASDAKPGDHVLVMSNGAFGGIHEKLVARLAANG